MGAVFEATHVKLGQRVAIKMLLPELLDAPDLVARFEREARAAARLRHRNAARVTDVDQTDAGVPYMVMELLHGHDLESELEARRPLPIGECVHYVMQAASAMSEAHALGTVHRDLKPSNLFLHDEADGSSCLKVLDFGISKLTTDDVRVTSTQTQMGTPLYMSPEQVRSAKNVDHRTDVWSLGVILYELLAGEPPFMGTAAGVGAAIAADDPRPLRELRPEVPEALAAVVRRAREKDPAKRFQSMQDLASALAPFSSVPTPIPSRPRVEIQTGARKPSATFAEAATLATPGAARTDGAWTTKPNARAPRLVLATIALAACAGAAGVWFFFAHTTNAPRATPAAESAMPALTATTATTAPAPSTSVAPAQPVVTASAEPAASVRAPKPVPTQTLVPAHSAPKPKPSTTPPVDNPERL